MPLCPILMLLCFSFFLYFLPFAIFSHQTLFHFARSLDQYAPLFDNIPRIRIILPFIPFFPFLGYAHPYVILFHISDILPIRNAILSHPYATKPIFMTIFPNFPFITPFSPFFFGTITFFFYFTINSNLFRTFSQFSYHIAPP